SPVSKPFRQLGKPLPEAEQARVRSIVLQLGERDAASALGVSDRTLVRCAGGFSVYAGTAALIRERLRELEAPQPRATSRPLLPPSSGCTASKLRSGHGSRTRGARRTANGTHRPARRSVPAVTSRACEHGLRAGSTAPS